MPNWEEFLAKKNAAREPSPTIASGKPSEATVVHTYLLRLALAVEDTSSYWERLDSSVPIPKRAKAAFEQQWFGAMSLDRVRYLITSFVVRYDTFPNALTVLSRWPSMDISTRQVICHWHLQLSDPIYRRFTGELLPKRRALREPNVDRDITLQWLKAEFPDKWSESTCFQLAGKLLTAAREAGLVSRRDPRTLSFPRVSDHALAYLLYLLRETRFEGTLTSSPYLKSVGLDEHLMTQRMPSLPGVALRKASGGLVFDWAHKDLASWVKEVAL